MLSDKVNYKEKGNVFNIQRFSVNDGPGIRTIVFLKGCPLSCRWCSNPESQNRNSEIMFNIKNCTECHRCERVCSEGAIDFNLSYRIDRSKCINCGRCVERCYPGALVRSGEEMTVKEIIQELKKESVQFRRSNGGVTLSGGEPLMQSKFALELLKGCKSMGWHTTMETTAYASKDIIDKVMPWLDLILLDIKTVNSDKHFKYTGVRNETILENAKRISELGIKTIVRVPVIPEFNADKKSIYDIAIFATKLKMVDEIHLLPYHKLGVNKYACIGKKYNMGEDIKTPSNEFMLALKDIVENVGLKCNIGAI
ncbi:glycyl-radical enzyme activating protein [Clostridium botulinum]|uniref:Radical SAM protein n=1 Tax=Clostridium botulinum C/D str. DC5 TaxID=1443128 RepID=A0A0A0IGW0_CLOBO|nr:glycyl-radical enzyme activating protein [Clostridium botulinum]KEI01731.1 radical SAM protein [Clostridium botulinum C/D str. BKT75002]KEI07453.1 radical SAM protein [Clostridium botulinum C/D str. BKT2873]KGM93257.1 radical SAM protein [Clostridium botulinum D str. CCUG 7971]KGM99818.1 radical SAM protein [Clostridium botulinum C/D str. DC5]KOC49370.1 radical SAM protein [Clostridium botulinum]